MIGRDDGHSLAVFQVIGSQRAQHALGTALDENPRPVLIQRLHTPDELHRRCHLVGKQIRDALRSLRVEIAGHIGDNGQFWSLYVHPGDDRLQRLAGWRHDLRMKGVRDRDLDRL